MSDYVALTSTVRVMFVASDLGDGSVVEAGIDDVQIFGVSCATDTCPVDFNDDGVLDFLDISAFVAAYTSSDPLADLNSDGDFDFLDISVFLAAYSEGCP